MTHEGLFDADDYLCVRPSLPFLTAARDELVSGVVADGERTGALAVALAVRDGDGIVTLRHVRVAMQLSSEQRGGDLQLTVEVAVGGLIAGGGLSGFVALLAGSGGAWLTVTTCVLLSGGIGVVAHAIGYRRGHGAARTRVRRSSHPESTPLDEQSIADFSRRLENFEEVQRAC